MRIRFAFTAVLLFVVGLCGCSPDFLRVHQSRINSAKSARKALELGPQAPGAFVKRIHFSTAEGFRFDPGEVRFSEGTVKRRVPTGVSFETSQGIPFVALFQFDEKTAAHRPGEIRYQLSPDRSRWYFHDGKHWVAAAFRPEQASSAEELNRALRSFHLEVEGGQLYLRIFLPARPEGPEWNGAELLELQQLEIHGISPRTDGWN